jgi:hypothetical protein
MFKISSPQSEQSSVSGASYLDDVLRDGLLPLDPLGPSETSAGTEEEHGPYPELKIVQRYPSMGSTKKRAFVDDDGEDYGSYKRQRLDDYGR